jgi:hypothetical protein
MTIPDVPLDSKEGMEILARFARGGGFVLNEAHERLAKKHGVSLEGIVISRPLPA